MIKFRVKNIIGVSTVRNGSFCIFRNSTVKNFFILLPFFFNIIFFRSGCVCGSNNVFETPNTKRARLEKEMENATPGIKQIIKAELEEINGNYLGGKQIPSHSGSTPKKESKIKSPEQSEILVPELLIKKIDSSLKDKSVIDFFRGYVLHKVLGTIRAYKESEIEINSRKVIDDFFSNTSGLFFEKISGNTHQSGLKDKSKNFSKNTDFFLSKSTIKSIRDDALTVVRLVMDFSHEDIIDEYSVTPKDLTRKIKKLFLGSRKFLQDQAVEQISDFRIYLNSGIEEYNFNERALLFKKDGYRAVIRNKGSGDEFGEILSLENKETGSIFRYFIKAYSGYPIKNSAEGSGALSISSGVISGAKSGNVGHFTLPNLIEPFIYKILESVKIGPKSEFILNPYIENGFYIATRGLTDLGQTFKEVDKLDSLLVKKIEEMDKQNMQYNIFNINITMIDFIARVMQLSDLNKGNFGFVLNGNNEYTEENFVANISVISPYIIDFRVNKEINEIYTIKIGCNFLNGNSTINYGDESIMAKILKNKSEQEKFFFGFKALQQFQSRLDIARPINDEEIEEEYKDDFQLEEILKQKSSEIKSLMLEQRGTNDKPQEFMLRDPTKFLESEEDYYNYFTDPESGRLLIHQEFLESNMNVLRLRRPRTNAELIGFKLGKKPEDYNPSEGQLDYIEDAFEDLDNYCEGIMNNYKTLKKFIIDGYSKYFDEQGNLRVQSASKE